MKVGYARISTSEQSLALQEDALIKAGCERVFTDVASGSKTKRPGLDEATQFLRDGDTLVVWKLDRLGRSMTHLIQSMEYLKNRNISFQSLQESIDTSTSTGKLVFYIFSAIAEFERDLTRERTNAGLKIARARGRFGGRPALLDEKKIKRLCQMYYEQRNSIYEICKVFDIKKATMYSYLKKAKTLLPDYAPGAPKSAAHQ